MTFSRCADFRKIHCLLWRGQPTEREVHLCTLTHIQCGHVRNILEKTASPPVPAEKMVVILDNARYHHAKLLKPLLKKNQKHLELLFLPPYSPQLAPIERVWKLARRLATHNRYFASLVEVQIAIESCFDQWRKPNSVLLRLCGII